MRIHIKGSILVSMAALGFFAAVGISQSSTVSAKSRVRVTSNVKLRGTGASRNVTFTGKAALWTKASALKGAKKVATTITLRDLAKSTRSSKNVRAYRVARTNRGKVYYKVVTFDGKDRGWIYGGKSRSSFAGGVKSYLTFQQNSLTDDMSNGTFQFANPGTANNNQTVTYKQPAWTQYKVGRQVTDSRPYANVSYQIDQAGIRTREGDQWVHISATNNGNSGADGWILYSGLKKTTNVNSPIADNAIRIKLVDSATGSSLTSVDYTKTGATKGATIGSNVNGTWKLDSNDSSSIQSQIASALSPLGYPGFTLTQGQIAAIAQGTFGSSVTISVVKPTINKAVRIVLTDPSGNVINYVDYTTANAAKGQPVGVQDGSTWKLAATDTAAIQSKLVDALKGTGFALSADNTLTADQQAQIAQTTFGNQVSIKTVAVNPVKDNEVQLSFVDQSGKAVGSTILTKGTNDKTALDTIKAVSVADPTSSDAATLKKAYDALLAKAGIKGYYTTDLQPDQLKANTAALNAATYGQSVKLIVAKIPVKSLASSFTFFDHAQPLWGVFQDEPIKYIEDSEGKRDEATNFSKLLSADVNLNGYAKTVITLSNFNDALKAQHLDTIYYAAFHDGPFNSPKSHLESQDFGGTNGSLFNDSLENTTKITVYKVSLTAKSNDNTVALDNGKNLDTPLFDTKGNVTIGDTPVKVGLKYTQVGAGKVVTIDATNRKAQSLAALYNK